MCINSFAKTLICYVLSFNIRDPIEDLPLQWQSHLFNFYIALFTQCLLRDFIN